MKRAHALGLAWLALAPSARAEQGRYQLFLDKSYVFLGSFDKVLAAPSYYTDDDRKRDGDVVFEALAAPHLFFLNQLNSDRFLFGHAGADGAGRPPWVASFTFLVRLRQLGGFSQPLRNPSFMPRFHVQRLWIWRGQDVRKGNWKGPIWILAPEAVVWGHHSNGGAGCLFLEDREQDDTCVADVPPEQRRVNTRNGSFSTDYVRLGASLLRGQVDQEGFLGWSWTLGAWVELNPKGWGPGAISDEQRRIYGPERFKLAAELQKQARIAGRRFSASLAPSYERIRYDRKPSPDASPQRFIVDAALTRDERGFARHWGIALRFYRGQDFYNLLFVRDIRRFQLGVVYDPSSRSLKEP